MEVLVLYYGCDDQDVLQQGDDTQDQEDLMRAEHRVTEREVRVDEQKSRRLVLKWK